MGRHRLGLPDGYAISLDERTYQYMHSKSPKNYFRVNDPVIDELCTQLRQTPDRAEQRAITRKIVAREHDQVLRMWMPFDAGFSIMAAARAQHRSVGPARERWIRGLDPGASWIDK